MGAGFGAFISFCVFISFFVDVVVNEGNNVLIAVLACFLAIYILGTLEFFGTCCNRKSGKMRFREYENQFSQIYYKSNELEMGLYDQDDHQNGDQHDSQDDRRNSIRSNHHTVIEEEYIE